VDTIVHPPGTRPILPDGVRRRHWAPILLIGSIAFVIIAVTFGSTWIAHYDPFAPGFLGYGRLDDAIRVTEVDALGASRRLFEMPVSGPTHFRYAFSITNTGSVSVRIDGIGPATEQTGELRFRSVGVVPDLTERVDSRTFDRWHPFVLAPGQHAGIEMEVAFQPRRCLPRGMSLSWWPETIRFTVLGIGRTTSFGSDPEVRVVGTEVC
jgi:hypothetical protein